MRASVPILTTTSLSVGYGSGNKAKTILAAINLDLYAGELVAFMGQNGVGKSTLLRTLAGIQKPLLGSVTLKGKPLESLSSNRLARIVSLVLTETINPGNLTVYELIALGRYPYTGWTGNLELIDREKVEWAIDITRTNYIADKPVLELSDGQMQKALIARALAQDGEIIILDEPTAHLDLTNQVEIMTLLKTLAETTGKAILVSTHELEITLQTCHKLWLANFGKPITWGVPEDLVISGALADTFFSTGYEWDATTRQFKLERSNHTEIRLSGEGSEHYWTQHALERSGFKISSTPGIPEVLISTGQRINWILKSSDNEQNFKTIRDLLDALGDLKNDPILPV